MDVDNFWGNHSHLLSTAGPENLGGADGGGADDGIQNDFSRILFSYEAVNRISIPILFLFGTIGNCLSVTVFCLSPTHRHLSSSYYLSALAISDTGFLVSLLLVWLDDTGIQVITRPLTCPLVMYLGQVTCFLSVWLTVAFTTERFCAVCYPLTRPTVCTVARAKKVIGILTSVAMLAFSYVWYIARVVTLVLSETGPPVDITSRVENSAAATNETSGGGPFGLEHVPDCNDGLNMTEGCQNVTSFETLRVCYVREEHTYISSIASHIDSFLTLIIPFCIITYLNVRISVCVWKLKGQRESIIAVSKIGCSAASAAAAAANANSSRPTWRNRIPMIRTSSQLSTAFSRQSSSSAAAAAEAGTSSFWRLGRSSSRSDDASFKSEVNSGINHTDVTPNVNQRNQNSRYMTPPSATETRITKTLLLVSTAFLVLNLPSHAVRAIMYIQSLTGAPPSAILQAAQHWANILFNLNFGVNFLLYCASGRNFRKSLVGIFFQRRGSGRQIRRNTSATATQKSNIASIHQTAAARNKRNGCYNNNAGAIHGILKNGNAQQQQAMSPTGLRSDEIKVTLQD